MPRLYFKLTTVNILSFFAYLITTLLINHSSYIISLLHSLNWLLAIEHDARTHSRPDF